MKIFLICVSIFLASCGSTPKKNDFQYKPITQALLEHVKQEEKIGEKIYKKDSYAWYASDYLMEKNLIEKHKNLKGWIVDLEAKNPSVIFMSYSNNEPKSELIVQPSEYGSIHYLPSTTLSRHKAMFKARMIALNNTKRMCEGNYNTAIIDDKDNWGVYLLVAPSKENMLFAGGNYKITINKNTYSIVETQALSKTCFAMPYGGKQKAMPMFTHIVEPTPNAVHAFLSLQNELDYYVVTDRGLWKISNGKITFIQDKE